MKYLFIALVIALHIYAFSPLIPGSLALLGIIIAILLVNAVIMGAVALGLLTLDGFNRTRGR